MRNPVAFRQLPRAAATILAGAVAAASCDRPPPAGTLEAQLARQAAEAGVPRDLLAAIARVEGGLEIPARRTARADAHVPAAGPLQLRRGRLDTLAWGAALVGVPEIELRRDADLALAAAARVLAALGARTDARASDLESWRTAIEEMGGHTHPVQRRAYADRVLATLAAGGVWPGRDGLPVAVPPHPELRAALAPPARALNEDPAEYGPAEWFPTSCANKCSPGRDGLAVQWIVIHDTEGGWEASVATLQNDAGKSVHYIVGTDGRVGQFIHEADTAWHAGNFYYNQRSIGIEHVGYTTQPFAEAEYAASALLVGHLTEKYGVPKDRSHIIGHDQVPDGTVIGDSDPPCPDAPPACEKSPSYGGANNHRDPGDWEWCTYMPRFGGACKCNDVLPTWSCSSDHTQAVRCADGVVVERQLCPGGCETRPAGTDSVCHETPPDGGWDTGEPADDGAVPGPPPKPTGNSDADPGANTDAGAGTGADENGGGGAGGAAADGPGSRRPASGGAGGCGCRAAGARRGETSGGAAAIAVAALLVFALARPRRQRPGAPQAPRCRAPQT